MQRHHTCRFCGVLSFDSDLYEMVKYGRRHYAHQTCYLDAGKKLEDLQPWQVGRFALRVLRSRKLEATAHAILEKAGL